MLSGILFGKNIALVISMKLRDLTEEQADKICDYIVAKYCPVEKDRFSYKIWKACEHCPFGVSDGKGDYTCAVGILENELDPELEEVIKND